MSDLALWRAIQEAQALGVSSNAALRLYRQSGGKIRRERWLELWRSAALGVEVFAFRNTVRPPEAA